MKIIKSLLSNFQILNFFLASVILGGIFGWWYIPQSSESSSSSIKDKELNSSVKSPLENFPTIENKSPEIPSLPTQLNNQSQTTESPTIPPAIESQKKTETVKTSPIYQQPKIENKPPEIITNQSSPTIAQSQIPTINSLLSNTYFGHFPFAETPRQSLVNMGNYYNRTEFLHQEAGNAFNRMRADAKVQGVELVLISGFRSISDQTKLFQKQIQKRGSKEAASKLSAPPGHSEHHTGYALDIGDGKQPSLDLKFQFESSQAYSWLTNNAHRYGFELSFPKNNIQGVSFEPWHWRYVASNQANSIFAMPRNLLYVNK
ncbi:D-alanyl-D-alanine carboxypeptidase [Geminocystis sp. NIES-3708]|uniref:M15 family metallopeptidase n=1 Tax=Geminocystis sp. NIES-3708 TaxID=1615909 RepID=UPI0005FC95C1|nr:M15 family metallopeptidase [Geminocystis sp. NIES-3708]BAQ60099.1 D-alanyl-D-alanine carboxypeptidase [Geminocystis sp. NIES-3708]